LEDPVGPNMKPNLEKSAHDISEYLRTQNAYSLVDGLLKELMTKQPADPIQHMLNYLNADIPLQGPLKVVVSCLPSLGLSPLVKRLAESLGVAYISAVDLLHGHGINAPGGAFADDKKAIELVIERVKKSTDSMQGFVLEGFPCTRFQTSYLAEHRIVPTHVLVLTGAVEQQDLNERERETFRLHACHASTALEIYQNSGKVKVIDTSLLEGEAVLAEMMKTVRTCPRSKGPRSPPRIVIVGPRGIGAREHASRLAARLGAVLVDARQLEAEPAANQKCKGQQAERRQLDAAGRLDANPSIDVANFQALSAEDPLGSVGVRLRQVDCTEQGWVLCGFPRTEEQAAQLAADDRLTPMRVVMLQASLETCVQRLRHRFVDIVTGNVWTAPPPNNDIRNRLRRRPEDVEETVAADYATYKHAVPGMLQALNPNGADGRCLELHADVPPEVVFSELVEFVERPLPLAEL